MYSKSLVNATDSCQAVKRLNVSQVLSYNELEVITQNRNLILKVGAPTIAILFLIVTILYCYFQALRKREKTLFAGEFSVRGKEKEVDLKTSELNRREKAIEQKLLDSGNEQVKLLKEKNGLAAEQIQIEEQQFEEELWLSKLEHQELKQLDIEFANKLEEETEKHEQEVLNIFESSCVPLNSKFSSLTDKKSKVANVRDRLQARCFYPKRAVESTESSTFVAHESSIRRTTALALLEKLEDFTTQMESENTRNQFQALLDAIRDQATSNSVTDGKNKEYADSLYNLEKELLVRRRTKFKQVSRKRE